LFYVCIFLFFFCQTIVYDVVMYFWKVIKKNCLKQKEVVEDMMNETEEVSRDFFKEVTIQYLINYEDDA